MDSKNITISLGVHDIANLVAMVYGCDPLDDVEILQQGEIRVTTTLKAANKAERALAKAAKGRDDG